MENEKKKISTGEFVKSMKELRQRPVSPGFVDKFNKIMEGDERHDREKEKSNKRTARSKDIDV